jgi:hypothetical protein
MAERDGPTNRRPADVPSLAEKGQVLTGRELEFAALNKQLRACFVCKLIKAQSQVQSRSGSNNATYSHALLSCKTYTAAAGTFGTHFCGLDVLSPAVDGQRL